MASDSERTVIGSWIGTLPLRGMVGPCAFAACGRRCLRCAVSVVVLEHGDARARRSRTSIRPSCAAAAARCGALWRSSRPATPPTARRLASLFLPLPPSSSSSISSSVTTVHGLAGAAAAAWREDVLDLDGRVAAAIEQLRSEMSAIFSGPAGGCGFFPLRPAAGVRLQRRRRRPAVIGRGRGGGRRSCRCRAVGRSARDCRPDRGTRAASRPCSRRARRRCSGRSAGVAVRRRGWRGTARWPAGGCAGGGSGRSRAGGAARPACGRRRRRLCRGGPRRHGRWSRRRARAAGAGSRRRSRQAASSRRQGAEPAATLAAAVARSAAPAGGGCGRRSRRGPRLRVEHAGSGAVAPGGEVGGGRCGSLAPQPRPSLLAPAARSDRAPPARRC